MSEMPALAIIQARMCSTRLPGKVLKKIAGEEILLRVKDRTSKIKGIIGIVVATSNNPKDKKIISFCKRNKISFYIGDEEDVLKRFVDCAKNYPVSTVIRITSDNPCINPKLVSKLLSEHQLKKADYTLSSGFPLGMGAEIFSLNALKRIERTARKRNYKEHLGVFFLDHRKDFKIVIVQAPKKFRYPKIRLTIDTKEDFITVKNVLRETNDQPELKNIIDVWKNKNRIFTNKSVKQFYPNNAIKKIFRNTT